MYENTKPPTNIVNADAREFFQLGLYDAYIAENLKEHGVDPKADVAGICFHVARSVEKLLKALIIHKANAIPWNKPDHHIKQLVARLTALGLALPPDLNRIIDLQECSVDVGYHIDVIDNIPFTITDLTTLLERFVGWAQIVA